jgi:hypothetical protein
MITDWKTTDPISASEKKRTDRVRHIRDRLECGMQRASQIEKASRLLDWIDHIEQGGSINELSEVMRQVVLDQYGVRDMDWGKIA